MPPRRTGTCRGAHRSASGVAVVDGPARQRTVVDVQGRRPGAEAVQCLSTLGDDRAVSHRTFGRSPRCGVVDPLVDAAVDEVPGWQGQTPAVARTNAPETARRSDGCKLRLDRCVARATRRLCLLHRGLHEGELAEGNARDAPRDQHDQPYCREGATPGARTCSHPPTPPLCCLIPDRAEQTTDRDLKIR